MYMSEINKKGKKLEYMISKDNDKDKNLNHENDLAIWWMTINDLREYLLVYPHIVNKWEVAKL